MADTEKTKVFLRELAIKVKNGVISKTEATKLAALAVSEVAKTPVQEPANAADENVLAPDAPEAAPAPAPSAVDPKSQLMSLLTGLEQSYAAAWADFQAKATALIQGTEGAAVPVGDFSLGMGDSSVKFSIEQADSTSAKCAYSVRKVWTIPNIVLPTPVVKASVEPSCHLPLRREILSRAEEISEFAENELTWKKYKIPASALFTAKEEALSVNDKRLADVLSAIPNNDDKFAKADSWKKWATAAQVYLLGSDYAETKEFSQILAEV